MNSIEDSRAMIEELFASLNEKLQKPHRLKKSKNLKKFLAELELLQSELQNFEVSIHIINNVFHQQKYSKNFNTYHKRYQKIRNKADKITKSTEKSLPVIKDLSIGKGGISKEMEITELINSVQIYDTSAGDLIKIGDHFMNRALEETKRIHKELDRNNQQADAINVELKGQNERLEVVDEEMSEIKMLLVQSKKRIIKMLVSFYKDRIILVLCILVLLLSVIVVAVKLSGHTTIRIPTSR